MSKFNSEERLAIVREGVKSGFWELLCEVMDEQIKYSDPHITSEVNATTPFKCGVSAGLRWLREQPDLILKKEEKKFLDKVKDLYKGFSGTNPEK